ncbi:MAG: RNA polymerase sigma factor [Steroidobacteraceae bacterium]
MQQPATEDRRQRAQQVLALFLGQHAKLVGFLHARVGSRAEAEDLAQRAYVRLLTVEKEGSARFVATYLYKTALHLATDRLRQQMSRQNAEAMASLHMPRVSPSLEPLWIAQERIELLNKAMEQLPPRVRMVLRLRVHEEYSFEDIVKRMAAEGIRIDVRTAKRYVSKATVLCEQYVSAAEQGGGKPNDRR